MHPPPLQNQKQSKKRKRITDKLAGHENKKASSRGKGDDERVFAHVPIRECADLYASPITIDCAWRGCIPCAYKIGCFDIALDKEFTRRIPNQRPELCPRSSPHHPVRTGVMGYQAPLRVLTVGDGDFSFSLALSRIKGGPQLLATAYESRETLLQVYPGLQDTLTELEARGTDVRFQIDATDLVGTLQLPSDVKFDRIVWNFPCEGVAHGRDGQNEEMEHNKDLIRRFVVSAQNVLSEENGQIHMNHKTKPPYNQWRIEDIVLAVGNVDNCNHSDISCPSLHMKYGGRIVLDRSLFPPYSPRKALDKKSFPIHDACTYVFGYALGHEQEKHKNEDDVGDDNDKQGENTKRTRTTLFSPFMIQSYNPQAHIGMRSPSALTKVDDDLIQALRHTLLSRHIQH